MGLEKGSGGPRRSGSSAGPPSVMHHPHGPLGVGRISAELSQQYFPGSVPLVLVFDDLSDHQAVRQPASLRVRLTPR